MPGRSIEEMRKAHRVLAEFSYEPKELKGGYADRWLRIDVGSNEIEARPVTQEMKDLWVGGKGFDLWLTFQEVTGNTTWRSSENPICFSSGPLGGTTSFPGSGKTLATAISPMTDSMIDCNVGGYFGPFLKFAGFDAMMVTGKASQEVIVFVDAVNHKVTIEAAPEESVDSHLVAEELTEMYADGFLDRRNIAVVSAGRAAEHVRMGVLNFSFYDWRRRVPRLKQAGRGGIGTVFRDKQVKALVIKNHGISPAWRIADSKAAQQVVSTVCESCGSDVSVARQAAEKFAGAPGGLFDMMQEVQDAEGYLSRAALEELTFLTGVTLGTVYEIASFYGAFSLSPQETPLPRVRDEMAAFVRKQMFLPGSSKVFDGGHARHYLAPGAWDLLAGLFESSGIDGVTPELVDEHLGAKGVPAATWHPEGKCSVADLAQEMGALAAESCGKCTPCREGLFAIERTLARICAGGGGEGDLGFLEDISSTLKATGLCAFGRSAPAALDECLAANRCHFMEHIEGADCTVGKEVN